MTVVTDPGFTQYLPAVSAFEDQVIVIVLSVGAVQITAVLEGVGGGSQAHHRFTSVSIVDDVFHLFVRQFAKAGKQNHHIGRLQMV